MNFVIEMEDLLFYMYQYLVSTGIQRVKHIFSQENNNRCVCFLAMRESFNILKNKYYILCIFQISPSLIGLASDSQQMSLPIHQSL